MIAQKRIDDGIKRAALYARVSTEEQAMHGVSLDAQRERLIQYAKDNNLEIVDIFIDEGISARKRYTARPAFTNLLERVRNKEVDVILFIKLDRWFRNIADFYEVQAILDRHKVHWIATEEDYDTTTANGRLNLNIRLTLAQDESDRTSERIKFVFKNMVKEGRVISGQTSIGLKIVDKHMVIDEDKVEITRDLFRHFIDTRSTMAAQRFILSKYDLLIDLKTIKRMLLNPMYIGQAYGIENWCPAAIDKETFALAGEILKVRAERFDTTRTDRIYLFTGLLFCEKCGRRMTTYSMKGSRGQQYIYYRCPGHMKKICSMTKQFNQDTLEQQLLDGMYHEAKAYNVDLESVKKKLQKKSIDPTKIYTKIEKLKDLYLNDLIPKEIYEKSYIELSTQLQEIQKQEFTQDLKPIDLNALQASLELYKKLDQPARKAFWSRTVSKVIMLQDGTFRFSFNQLF